MNEEENKRLNLDNIERPNTKWTFIKFSNIEVKAVLDNQPVHLGHCQNDCRILRIGVKCFR